MTAIRFDQCQPHDRTERRRIPMPAGSRTPGRRRRAEPGFLASVQKNMMASAGRAGLSPDDCRRLAEPERVLSVRFDVPMDDGRVRHLKGWRVLHSTLLGPGKGGLRFASGVDAETLGALAAEMPSKTAIYGLPLGGGKGGVDVDASSLSPRESARVMRGFVRAAMDCAWQTERTLAFGPQVDAPAPDVGTSRPDINLMDVAVDEFVAWIVAARIRQVGTVKVPKSLQRVTPGREDETPFVDFIADLFAAGDCEPMGLLGAFTGKSIQRGGSLGRREATGLGVALATLEMLKHQGALPESAERFAGETVAIQGFGNVGWGAAQAFTRLGARVVAIAEFDSEAYVLEKVAGFDASDVEALEQHKAKHGTLRGFPGSRTRTLDEFWSLPVDALVPCAREGVIDEAVALRIRARILVEGANGPTTGRADRVLEQRGVTVVPDVFANAAGVTVSYFEMRQNQLGERWTQIRVERELRNRVKGAFAALAGAQQRSGGSWREAAVDSAVAALSCGLGSLRHAA